jgi:hypothetical protein
MTEEQLSQLRSRLGVNTFGTFVDRYYGMTPKEEEAHVRQVKRFAKGLFANVLGDANRCVPYHSMYAGSLRVVLLSILGAHGGEA